MVRLRKLVYQIEVDGEITVMCGESTLYEKYLSMFKKSDVDIIKIGDTFILNNLNNTVAFAVPVGEEVEVV